MKRLAEDQRDSKIRMPGAMDRGPIQFNSRAAKRSGAILTIATSEVITAPPTTPIIGAIKIMTSYGIGRLPIADAGTNRLIGFVTGVDMVDFMGGGIRHNLLKKKYEGNILSAIFQRLRWKYRERTYRYALLEAGHIGQNLYLAATSMGLGACAVGAFLDDELNDLLGLDGQEEAALYMISVGQV